jgi:hypothetical protein
MQVNILSQSMYRNKSNHVLIYRVRSERVCNQSRSYSLDITQSILVLSLSYTVIVFIGVWQLVPVPAFGIRHDWRIKHKPLD